MIDNSNDTIGIRVGVGVKKPGFFTRVVDKMQNRPIATSLGLGAAGAAAAIGGYNMKRYGTVLPPAADGHFVGGVAAAAFASFLG